MNSLITSSAVNLTIPCGGCRVTGSRDPFPTETLTPLRAIAIIHAQSAGVFSKLA